MSRFILAHFKIATPPQAHPARNMSSIRASHTRLYSIHFCVAAARVKGGIMVCTTAELLSSVLFISGMSVAGSLVQMVTMYTLFQVKSTCAPGNRCVTSDCCGA